MTFRCARMGAAAGAAVSALFLGACAGSGLSAASSCHDFMNASPSEQHEVIDQLASKYDKPDYTSPLGEPEVPYYCTANPSVTLEEFFKKAEG